MKVMMILYLPICSAVLMNRWEKMESWMVSSSVPIFRLFSLPTRIHTSPQAVIIATQSGSTKIVL